MFNENVKSRHRYTDTTVLQTQIKNAPKKHLLYSIQNFTKPSVGAPYQLIRNEIVSLAFKTKTQLPVAITE